MVLSVVAVLVVDEEGAGLVYPGQAVGLDDGGALVVVPLERGLVPAKLPELSGPDDAVDDSGHRSTVRAGVPVVAVLTDDGQVTECGRYDSRTAAPGRSSTERHQQQWGHVACGDSDVSLADVDDRGVVGELDYGAAGEFRATVLPLFEVGGLPVVAVLDGISFVDSSGLGALLAARRRAGQVGGTFSLAAPAPVVVRRLRQMALDRYFPLVDPPPTDQQR